MIQLTKGMVSLIDDEDFHQVNSLKWYVSITTDGKPYARHDKHLGMNGEKEIRKRISLHRFLMGVEDPKIFVDHKNGNTLDNRKENLRIASVKQNNQNRNKQTSHNTSGYRGVSYNKKAKKYEAYGNDPTGKRIYLGLFSNPKEAAKAFDEFAKINYGKFMGQLNLE